MQQLNSKAFGLALGLFAGGAWFIVMAVSFLTGFLDQTVQTIGGLHPAFAYTWTGLIWMVAMHLVGGFIAGFAIAWIYNKLN